MNQRGIDIRAHRSKHLNEYLVQPSDYVITVCDNAAEPDRSSMVRPGASTGASQTRRRSRIARPSTGLLPPGPQR
jgi:protein-tyrosine-phosphatase